jgi:transposase
MSRHNLTDWEWKSIRVFLPAERSGSVGRPWVSHRKVIDGILWVLCSGGRWKDVPAEFGNHKTIYNRFYRWTQEGMWKRIVNRLLHRLDALGKVDRSLWCVDSSVIRAHRVASGARRGKLSNEENARKNALGRSKGGYSTKIHIATDAKGLPLGVTATPGQCGETPELENLFSSVPLKMHHKWKRPKAIAGDKAYSAKSTRNDLNIKGIKAVIPKRENEKRNKRFAKKLYKKRNIVERVIGWLKESRRIATRYDKKIDCYLAMIHIAMIRMLLKRY